MMQDNTNNKEYWNNYVEYWEKRIDVTNNSLDSKDKTISDNILKQHVEKLGIFEKGGGIREF